MDVNYWEVRAKDAEREIAALTDALTYYAAPETWWLHGEVVGDDNGIPLTGARRPIDADNGARARAALGRDGKEDTP